MAEHTPGPWRYTCRGEIGEMAVYVLKGPKSPGGPPTGLVIAHLGLDTAGENVAGAEREANASRIVACVNACKGINPEAVPVLLGLLRNIRDNLKDYDDLGDTRLSTYQTRFMLRGIHDRIASVLADTD